MARRSKVITEPVVYERYFKGEEVLIASPSFIYDIEAFVNGFRYFRLIESKTVKSEKYIAPGRVITVRDKTRTIFIYTLRGAPKKWLQENFYTFEQ